jgi:putative membrane protein insertion efficiency factor
MICGWRLKNWACIVNPSSKVSVVVGHALRACIWLYRHSFSYFLGRQCRFMPTCSAYADEAIRVHGAGKGLQLACKRLCQCHPWGKSGFDPVPAKEKSSVESLSRGPHI